MRYVLVTLGFWSLVMGQAPTLAWVELADTVYAIDNQRDTFAVFIQKSSGNVRHFIRYNYNRQQNPPPPAVQSDSVYLDGNNRVNRVRQYAGVDPNQPPNFLTQELRFIYSSSPTVKVESRDDLSSTPLAEAYFYGLTTFEGSLIWSDVFGEISSIPVEAYPQGYRTGQWGDSVYTNYPVLLEASFAVARRPRSNLCDTLLFYEGPASGPLTFKYGGNICHTNGRIDSIIVDESIEYWSYNSAGLPVRYVIGTDTTIYTYSDGRLIQTRISRIQNDNRVVRTYYLRYRGLPGSLAFEAEKGCLSWDAVSRRGSFPCRAAGEVTAVQLYDVQGRVVWESRVEGNGVFEIPASLPSGLYYLRGGEQVARVYILP